MMYLVPALDFGASTPAPFDPSDISGMLQRTLDTNPGYHGSTLGGLPILNAEESGTLAQPRGQTCLSFDGVNDQLTWTATNTGTQYVTYYNPATATWVSPVTLTHNGTAYVFAPGAVKVTNLKRWSIASPTSGQIEAITLTAAQGSGGLVSWHWCNEESGSVTYDVANVSPLNATLTNGPTWTTDSGVNYNPANWLGHSKVMSFDGVNDVATGSADSAFNTSTLTITAWVNLSSYTGYRTLISKRGATQQYELSFDTGNGKFGLFSGGAFTVSTTSIALGTWAHIAMVISGASTTYYLNGVADGSAAYGVGTTNSEPIRIGNAGSGGQWFPGVTYGVRIYNVAKTAGEVAAIHSGTNDTTGLLALYNDQYDESGNNRHLTLTGGASVVVIPRNESNTSQDAAGNALGVTGPLKHPATTEVRAWTGDGSGAHIACGNVTFDNTINWEVATWVKFTGTGSDNRIWEIGDNNGACLNAHRNGTAGSIGLQVGSSNYVRHTGSTSFADNAWHYVRAGVSSGVPFLIVDGVAYSTVINAMTNTSATRAWLVGKYGGGASNYFAGSVCGMSLLYGGVTRYPLFDQCGPGTSNTNRDFYILFSDGTSTAVSGGVVNGTVATMYANYCPYAQDWCVNNGGGVAANGAFIPGRIGTGLDALGNAKTLTVGKHGNPYSLLVRNPWSAPELVNIGIPSSNKIAPSVDVQVASVVDTQFNRILSTGSDRYLAYRTALTGTDKTNMEGYTT